MIGLQKFYSVLVVIVIIAITLSILATLDTYHFNQQAISEKIKISAVYYDKTKNVEIIYDDISKSTNSITLEVEGLDKSYRKVFYTSHIKQDIQFSDYPQYGWKEYPVIFDIDHKEFGKILLKTEISEFDQAQKAIIYARP